MEIKSAHELSNDGSTIRAILFEDGAINCCSLDSEGAEKCCFTSDPGEEQSYWAFLSFLTQERDYSVKEISITEVKPPQPCPLCESLKSLREMAA
jgi:hypothetical protein